VTPRCANHKINLFYLLKLTVSRNLHRLDGAEVFQTNAQNHERPRIFLQDVFGGIPLAFIDWNPKELLEMPSASEQLEK